MRSKLTSMLVPLMVLCMTFSFGQEKTISGNVTDQNGLPLPGVSVVVVGTSTGAQTDFDGNYIIKASPGQVLRYSYIGQATVNRTVGASDSIDVQMQEDTQALEEVVVTGYNSQSKAKISSSISTVKAEDIEQVPIASFEQILQGRAPGLEIRSGNGQPGASARIRIRGTASINGNNDPLIIVDGVPIDPNNFATLNPNNFENVSILKDAQASALYGSRAAAGVIVVTTKRGGENKKAQFSYRSLVGFSEVPEQNFEVLSATQFLQLGRDLGNNNLSDTEISEIVGDIGGPSLRDAAFKTGVTNSQEFNVRGGNQEVSYFASANYFEQEGTVVGSDFQRMTTQLNLDVRANDRLRFGITSSLGFSRSNFLVVNGGVNLNNPLLIPFIGNPTVPIFNDAGDFNVGDGLSFLAPNILERTLLGIDDNEEFKLVASGYFDFKFTDWLNFKYTLGVDFEDDFSVFATNPLTEFGRDATPGNAGNQSETSSRDTRIISTAQLRYQDNFGKHSVNASAFVEFIRGTFRSSTFQGFGIEPELFGFANSITPGTTDNGLIPTVGGFATENGLFSVFGAAGYEYDGKYGVDVGIRNDTSSRFSPANRSATFYSVAGRWNIDRENWFANSNVVNTLKLRGSFGTAGNEQSIGNFQFLPLLGRTLFEGNAELVQGGVANEGIRWEFTEQWNVGLDYGFFNNRISGSVDYYNRETGDLIIPFDLPALFGDNSVNANAGSLVNKGWELALSADIIRNEDVSLNVFGNIAFNDNEVTDLGSQVTQFEQGTSIIRVGESLGSHFIVDFAGVNPSNGEPLYRDIDGNITNVFSDANRTTGFGSSEPGYTGGFGFNFNYRGIQLSSLFSFIGEFNRFNNVSFFTENFNFFNAGLNQSTDLLNFFQNPGDITDIPAPQFQRNFTSRDIEDASFLRLRNVTLAYNIPQKFLEGTFLKGVRVYAQGINLAVWTEFEGFDPEDDNNIGQFEFPNPRQLTAGLDITF